MLSLITITGNRDHDRLEPLITITGMRSRRLPTEAAIKLFGPHARSALNDIALQWRQDRHQLVLLSRHLERVQRYAEIPRQGVEMPGVMCIPACPVFMSLPP
jgi:hypothetical protein